VFSSSSESGSDDDEGVPRRPNVTNQSLSMPSFAALAVPAASENSMPSFPSTQNNTKPKYDKSSFHFYGICV